MIQVQDLEDKNPPITYIDPMIQVHLLAKRSRILPICETIEDLNDHPSRSNCSDVYSTDFHLEIQSFQSAISSKIYTTLFDVHRSNTIDRSLFSGLQDILLSFLILLLDHFSNLFFHSNNRNPDLLSRFP